MNKEKFGLILVAAIFVSFVIGALLQPMNLENSNPEMHQTIFLTITIVAVSSGLLLWGMCMWDLLGNKQIKSSTLVFAALIVFNWVAAIVYYFKYIYRRSHKRAAE
jgi:small-conductance mechanosensitive channel